MMLFEVGDEVRVRQPTNLFHSELGKVVSIDHVKLTYKVVFHRGNSDVYTCFDLILVKRQEETSMEFKVGDKVKVSDSWRGNSGKVGTISRTDWGVMYKYRVEFEDADPESFKEEELESVKEGEKVMKFKVGDKVRVIRNTYGNRGKIGTLEKIDDSTMPYCVVFDDGRKEWCYGHEFKLLKEEKVMAFKVGDKVRINWSCLTNKDKEGVISEDDGSAIPYKVTLDDGKVEWTHGNLITKLEEKVMTFKVGDKVMVKDSWFGHDGQVGVVLDIHNYEPYNYNIEFDTEGDNERRDENFKEDSLELVTEEEEKVMEFKVGDKVKVSNSWEGRSGEVGEIIGADDRYKFKYTVAFNDGFAESFREGELELVKEKAVKQSFTKSDLKTGMGVVLRNGRKGHVLLDTVAGDVIRFINEGSNRWASVDEYDENMIDCDMSVMDIVEVYSSKYAYCYLTNRVFNQDCVFKREEPESEPKPEPEPTKMTVKEINEHFGKAIEIVE